MQDTPSEAACETSQLLYKIKTDMVDEAVESEESFKTSVEPINQAALKIDEGTENDQMTIDIVLNVEPVDAYDSQLPEAPTSLKLKGPSHKHQSRQNSTSQNNDMKLEFDTVSLSEPFCRVCQCNGAEERLISPCSCSGSVKWIHESCLIQWMKSSLKDSCELCTKKIKITKRRKPLSKWKLPSQRPTPVLWVLVFVTAIALNLASVVKDASKLCASTPCLVFYAVGCIGVILGTLFLIYWSKRAKVFINHWIELNEEWVIIVEQDQVKSSSIDQHVLSSNTSPAKTADEKSPHCTIAVNA